MTLSLLFFTYVGLRVIVVCTTWAGLPSMVVSALESWVDVGLVAVVRLGQAGRDGLGQFAQGAVLARRQDTGAFAEDTS